MYDIRACIALKYCVQLSYIFRFFFKVKIIVSRKVPVVFLLEFEFKLNFPASLGRLSIDILKIVVFFFFEINIYKILETLKNTENIGTILNSYF